METPSRVPRVPPALEKLARRRFLAIGGTAAALALTGSLPEVAHGIGERTGPVAPPRADDPFTLGVASGDPLPDGVVLWTRLALDPLAPHGGMGRRTHPVQWEVAEDERFTRVVRRGTAYARPEAAHSVHVDVRGLRPWREYHYRFRAGGSISPVGRTRTAPTPEAEPASLSLAFASCQAVWEGWFTAHRDLAERRHDVVLFLGDYIYEYGEDHGVRPDDGRPENLASAVTLDDYRRRYGLYKRDPDLQAAHASAPWVVVPDDHEVADNWAGVTAPASPVATVLMRRANALRAYWEHMPLRLPAPTTASLRLHRRLRYGRLAELFVLDTRQHRSRQAHDERWIRPDEVTADPRRTILGDEQERWLLDGLATTPARWKVMAHQTAMTLLDRNPGEGLNVQGDGWDGYSAARTRLLGGIGERGIRDVVGVAGDLHRTLVSDLAVDVTDPDSPAVATEFVGTSISSGLDGADLDPLGRLQLTQNPHLRFANAQRGYVSCTITPDAWLADFRVCDRVTTPGGTVSSRTVLAVESGRAAVVPA